MCTSMHLELACRFGGFGRNDKVLAQLKLALGLTWPVDVASTKGTMDDAWRDRKAEVARHKVELQVFKFEEIVPDEAIRQDFKKLLVDKTAKVCAATRAAQEVRETGKGAGREREERGDRKKRKQRIARRLPPCKRNNPNSSSSNSSTSNRSDAFAVMSSMHRNVHVLDRHSREEGTDVHDVR